MLSSSSVIFIGSPEKSYKSHDVFHTLKHLFFVSPLKLSHRIFVSFVPPFGQKYKTVHVDFLGPILCILLLAALLVYGHSFKKTTFFISPTVALCFYLLAMPIYCYILCKLSRAYISFSELISLIGYSLYGYIFTLGFSLLFYQETSNTFFFLCLIVFCGLSTFRLAIVLLKTIPLPGIQLIVCSSVSVVQILFLIFLHFAYMHSTFVYGQKTYLKH